MILKLWLLTKEKIVNGGGGGNRGGGGNGGGEGSVKPRALEMLEAIGMVSAPPILQAFKGTFNSR